MAEAKPQTNAQTFAALAKTFTELGLAGLFTNANGKPGGWLWKKIQDGYDTMDELGMALEQTEAFRRRYKVILDMRERSAKGENVHVPTVAEVRDYEDKAASVMRRAGLPAWFYDSYKDTQQLMAKNVSVAELEERVAQGWTQVRDVDPAVRRAFSEFYGVGQGDAALAAFILDPTRTVGAIDKAARTAYTAGYARTVGISVEKDLAEKVAMLPKTVAGIQQDLGEISAMQSLTTEGIAETTDLTDSDLVKAVSLGDGGKRDQLNRRLLERQANARTTTGGAAMTQAGVVGLTSS